MQKITEIPCSEIVPGDNDRTVFKKSKLRELAASIKEHGLAQPITVRPMWVCPACEGLFPARNTHGPCPHCNTDVVRGEQIYQIVAGERRYRAVSKVLGRDRIAAIVRRDLTEEDVDAIMGAENLARADLDPVDEALSYRKRMDRWGWDKSECARRLGVSTMRITNRLALLNLRDELQHLVRHDQLKLGYAVIIGETELDTNRQTIALKRLRENPHPTPYWFRRVCNELKEEQAQAAMFDLELLTVEEANNAEEKEQNLPPHPDEDAPPWKGDNIREVISNQIEFWTQAAMSWDGLGRPHKRQECQAAAQALKGLVTV